MNIAVTAQSSRRLIPLPIALALLALGSFPEVTTMYPRLEVREDLPPFILGVSSLGGPFKLGMKEASFIEEAIKILLSKNAVPSKSP